MSITFSPYINEGENVNKYYDVNLFLNMSSTINTSAFFVKKKELNQQKK